MRRLSWLLIAGLAGSAVPGHAKPPEEGQWTIGVVAHADSRGEILPCT